MIIYTGWTQFSHDHPKTESVENSKKENQNLKSKPLTPDFPGGGRVFPKSGKTRKSVLRTSSVSFEAPTGPDVPTLFQQPTFPGKGRFLRGRKMNTTLAVMVSFQIFPMGFLAGNWGFLWDFFLSNFRSYFFFISNWKFVLDFFHY